MERDDVTQQPQDAPDRERDPADPPEPRGNPEPERDSVERGEEQLDKISGN
jgi:hypothetical protein